MEVTTQPKDDGPQTPIPVAGLSRTRDNSESCVICLSAISERAITVPCNHYSFDFICLVSWLQERSACPLCNTDVTEVQYDFCSPTDYKTYTIQSTQIPSKPPGTASQNHYNTRGRFPHPSRPRGRRYRPPNPDSALLKRRHVYKRDLYSLHVGSNRVSRYQNLTPALITSSPDLQSRARTWIRRELRVFSYLNPDPEPENLTEQTTSVPLANTNARRASNAEFLLSYILAILKSVDLKAPSGQAEDMLAEFLGRPHARLFLHELGAWLRSPFARLEDWDRNVQYAERLPERFDENGSAVGSERQRGKREIPNDRSRSPWPQERSVWREEQAVRRYAPD